jgi:cell division control protein 7
VWSTGIIFLFFLTAKFPLFQSSDDVEALMELATILGKRKMERTATLHSKYTWTDAVSAFTSYLQAEHSPQTCPR